MATPAGQSLLESFDRIRIINLVTRPDRRREATSEFARLGIPIDGSKVAFHQASRPDDAGGFETIGARGCFFSHLGVLESALNDGAADVLILEDDLDFSRDAEVLIPAALGKLAKQQWGFFYGGHLSHLPPPGGAIPDQLWQARPDDGFSGTHFLALSRPAIELAVPYLKAMAERAAGSPEGGPMHVDGAYTWLRKAHPQIATWIAAPELGHQRSSRTDVHDLRPLDRIAVVRDVAALARRVKRSFL
ncbi:glycosyltransferase family 25 protein [Devosia submarina]|uniref:glycosyltransferase family 25 protein n=1 Tax=Devosia submarina TaxID=1173082 RepID=UPI000D37EB4A|nr:glycosyltransferase family 25 protein [Devosia submarina]